jgi:DNA-binding winged helix-turn-helix (wHTH) protein
MPIFEDFDLDPHTYQLRHSGARVRLERIPFELLCILVERRGQLVSRAEIAERIWGKGVFVDSDSGINTAIRKIRHALGDNADAPRFVVTIPARGYRFVAPVRESNGAMASDPVDAGPAIPAHRMVIALAAADGGPAQAFKIAKRPVEVYQAIRPSPSRRSAPDGFPERTLGPFVGREDEMQLLLGRWKRTCEGEGQAVLVVGEPGIGKTRLIEELRARLSPHPQVWIECAGDQSFTNTPFRAVIEALREGLGWSGNTTNEQRFGLLERSLGMAGARLAEAAPLVAEMVGLPVPHAHSALTACRSLPRNSRGLWWRATDAGPRTRSPPRCGPRSPGGWTASARRKKSRRSAP